MFNPIRNTKVYEQVIFQIKDMIDRGILKKGDKLPSEREMVEKLQVSRTSIREALRSLEIIGLIESRQGEGNFIRSSFENSLIEPLSIMFMLQDSKSEEILELRISIERETALLAAQRITDEELEEIELLVEKLKELKEGEEMAKVDREFHYKIAQASKNFLILSIFNAMSSLMETCIKDARKNILIKKDNKEILFKQHEDIYKALLDRDGEKALQAMKTHLDFANEYMRK
ncbi:GntR family transcriptional repressor for pyruvate dehydrogenase complex [Clostridium tetanomorphum]|uniref:FadR family transcriptional regulator n=1 Tax=Clostridium tetanomorphum TaxID=1553 RepID=A0A923E844_CLOTT|nr:FadR/GntR family transcriptional regulator [Clostridium tetanomorphum]KAJ53516.1 transcriptional regulator, pyruvate dehydrogenase complex repressor [Clostridium tetanomorphum DSM 665]MBC2396891.1 FadR family transcriptional regulator [Clostridium tetanomorphum]MBP1863146.1 GntR family transcriptional repressor for pyruvate dehydrogenase complex [Clostridium tetanomorphum]NRS84254.1 GntR family transcriptional repressor for pyruvate dehydrogenase complex [Clostridium tetanomorphum]NRZ97468.